MTYEPPAIERRIPNPYRDNLWPPVVHVDPIDLRPPWEPDWIPVVRMTRDEIAAKYEKFPAPGAGSAWTPPEHSGPDHGYASVDDCPRCAWNRGVSASLERGHE